MGGTEDMGDAGCLIRIEALTVQRDPNHKCETSKTSIKASMANTPIICFLGMSGTPILPPEATPYARQTLRPVVVPRVFPTFSDGIPTLDLLINYVERATGAHGVVARIVLTVRRRKVRNWRKERGASEEYISI